ncbi:Cysteine/O-acetylserine efflux protein [Pseudooceanicola marinus]|uniref:Cysteine/O-acetylserine efflux protein n=1 Tax=Pseudooceanicola marinus TaxID=396013 RepID=A0A1X6YSS2_9RHOB|nr:LysE family translocator [Pseudooceanicola marinus]PJE26111.1 LysE family translocator [Pseudooceanicola marinus]SLN29728.1 Cysteine/O-acetylserine efflux protein [Pseudooceanicola marinus]
MIGNTLILIAAALPLMGSPGPATISLASLGAAFGFRNALPYLMGIILGTIVVLAIIATGVSGVMSSEAWLLVVLRIAAVAYILYLAWKIATAPVGRTPTGADGRSGVVIGSFLPGLGLSVANPKAYAAIGAVYAGYSITPEHLLLDTLLKFAALAFVAAVVNTAWLAFGSTFARFLEDPSLGRAINIAFAIMLILSVGVALALG